MGRGAGRYRGKVIRKLIKYIYKYKIHFNPLAAQVPLVQYSIYTVHTVYRYMEIIRVDKRVRGNLSSKVSQ